MPWSETFPLAGQLGTHRCTDCGAAAVQEKVIHGTRRGTLHVFLCERCAVRGNDPAMKPGRIRSRQATPEELAGLRARTRAARLERTSRSTK